MKTSLLIAALGITAYPSLALATPSLAGLLQPEMIIASYTLAGLFFLCRTDQPRHSIQGNPKKMNAPAPRTPADSATPFSTACCTH